MTSTIETLDALFASELDLDDAIAMPAAPGITDGDDYEVRMVSSVMTIIVKC